METIGLLGGMSWESTVGYYTSINQGMRAALGELHSAKIALVSVDFDPVAKLQHAEDWAETGQLLAGAAQQIQAVSPGVRSSFLVSTCLEWSHGTSIEDRI